MNETDLLPVPRLRLLTGIIVVLTLFSAPTTITEAQDQKKSQDSQNLEKKLDEQTQQEPEDVVRVRTELVQTSVSVLDKNGKFVDNLRADDFELHIDDKPSSILFFERILNGKTVDSSSGSRPRSLDARALAPEDATRTVVFFVDDIHLSSESVGRTRKMLSNYIEQDMGEDDEALIVSASGQVGFLAQLTSEKEVLRAAIEKLKYRPQFLFDSERPQMSVFQALAIERSDSEVLKYFEDVLLSDQLAAQYRINPQMARDAAERMTRARASRILTASDAVITQTLSSLKSAIVATSRLRGRKLVVFVSDGFLVNNQRPNIRDQLHRITDAAVKTGVVMYTMQASGLNTSFPDARSDAMLIAGSGTGRLAGEDFASQDPLLELAADTGGKAVLNANDLNVGVRRALRESNDYYLLAWRPDTVVSPGKEFHRIEVVVKGRPDLSVLIQRGFFDDEASTTPAVTKTEKPKVSNGVPLGDLAAAIRGKTQPGAITTHLVVNYLDVLRHGPQLSVLVQVDKPGSSAKAGVKDAPINVAGVLYNESGKVAGSFVESLKPETKNNADGQHLTYLNQFDVKPGLYQVRVAARDADGASDMAQQWISVPDLSAHHLALSSLLIGERGAGVTTAGNATQAQKAQLKIDKRFIQNSRLRVGAFIYNASDTLDQPAKLSARIDVFSRNKAVVSTPTFAVDTQNATDHGRIPYAGELNLASLAKGHYRMRLTVIDLSQKTFASQEAAFEIE
jgi:VWFA-related protein